MGRAMLAFEPMREPLERAINCAQRIVDISMNVLNNLAAFGDDLRRLRRDLPHLNSQVMTAFRGSEPLAADLRHELRCLEQDAVEMADWAAKVADELDQMRATFNPSTIVADNQRYNDKQFQATTKYIQYREIVSKSCDRARQTAIRVCAAADQAARTQPSTVAPSSPGPGSATGIDRPPTVALAKDGPADPVERNPEPPLSDHQYEILEALFLLKALNPALKKTTCEIAEKIEKGTRPEYLKAPISGLVKLGLVGTKEGRGGGCWLEPKGTVLIKRILEERKQ
jgi:hypothetical protein